MILSNEEEKGEKGGSEGTGNKEDSSNKGNCFRPPTKSILNLDDIEDSETDVIFKSFDESTTMSEKPNRDDPTILNVREYFFEPKDWSDLSYDFCSLREKKMKEASKELEKDLPTAYLNVEVEDQFKGAGKWESKYFSYLYTQIHSNSFKCTQIYSHFS